MATTVKNAITSLPLDLTGNKNAAASGNRSAVSSQPNTGSIPGLSVVSGSIPQGLTFGQPKPLTVSPPAAQQPPPANNANGKVLGTTTATGTTAADLTKQLGEFADKSRSGADTAAIDLEDTARKNAELEYQNVLGALGRQREEVGTLATQQKEQVQKEVGQQVEDYTANQEKEVKQIGENKEQYKTNVQDQTEQLARNWRDMSLEVQRILRGTGRDSTSYASEKEAGLLSQFNQGLRAIAQKSADTLKNFDEAVTETVSYYTRAVQKIKDAGVTEANNIDNWVRQQISSIQNQEGTALTKKLTDINSALAQGRQLKLQVEQNIANQTLGIGTWLAQVQEQYKMAVATAATGKTEDAAKGIADTTNLVKLTQAILDGNGEIQQTEDGNFVIHGYIPNSSGQFDEVSIPVTSGYVQGQIAQRTSELSKIPGGADSTLTEQAAQSLGLGSNPFSTPQQSSGGVFGAIRNAFGL